MGRRYDRYQEGYANVFDILRQGTESARAGLANPSPYTRFESGTDYSGRQAWVQAGSTARTEAGAVAATALGLTSALSVLESPPNPETGEVPNLAESPVTTAPATRRGLYTWTEVSPPDPRAVAARTLAKPPMVRRPTLGLVHYHNRFASIEVVARNPADAAGTPVELVNSSYRSGKAAINTNFIVQGVSEAHTEDVGVVQTFGDWYLGASGETPRNFSISGVLFETKNFPWLSEFRTNYDRFLRGSRCILNRAMVYITIDDTLYIGYVVNLSLQRQVVGTGSWGLVPFVMQMALRRIVDIRMQTLFPETYDIPDVPDAHLVDEDGNVFVNGIRVSQAQGTARLDETGYLSPDASTLPDALEIISGAAENNVYVAKEPVLDWQGSKDDAALYVNVSHILSVARAINAARGRQVFDLGRLRQQYLLGKIADFEALGADIDMQQRYGLPGIVERESLQRYEERRRLVSDYVETGKQEADAAVNEAIDRARAGNVGSLLWDAVSSISATPRG